MVTDQFFLNSGSTETAGKSLLLTGSRSSSTGLIANLIGSFDQVELAYEPPTLRALFPLIEHMCDQHWRYIFDTFVFEEFLVNALAGRGLNFNSNDDSWALRSRGEAEVSRRLSKGHRQVELAPAAKQVTPLIKLPDVTPYLLAFRRLVPKHQAIVTIRRPERAIRTLMETKWLVDERLAGVSADWPNRLLGSPPIPHWVDTAQVTAWKHWTAEKRCCHYYQQIYKMIPGLKNITVFSIDAFFEKPRTYLAEFAEARGLSLTEQTEVLLEQTTDRDGTCTQELCIFESERNELTALHEACLSVGWTDGEF